MINIRNLVNLPDNIVAAKRGEFIFFEKNGHEIEI